MDLKSQGKVIILEEKAEKFENSEKKSGFSILHIDTSSTVLESAYSLKGAQRQCNICGYKSLFLSHLKRHYLSHSSERNFQCSLCTKKFKHKESLDYHFRTHAAL